MKILRLCLVSFLVHTAAFGVGGQYAEKKPTKPEETALADKPHKLPPPKFSPYTDPVEKSLYFGLEYLLWQFRLEGMSYAFNEFEQIENNPKHRRVRTVPNRWMSGVRGTLGTYLGHERWHTEATYTFYRNKEANSATNDGLYPLWAIGDEFAGPYSRGKVRSAGGKIDLMLNSVDFLLLNDYYDSYFVRMTPLLGLKGFWIKQNFTAKYAHQFATNFQELLTMQNNQAIVGFGPEIGMKARWSFDKMLSLVTNVTYGIFPTHFDTVRKDSEQLVPLATSNPITKIYTKNAYWGDSSFLQTTLGPQFEWWFSDVHFAINGLWEMQVWYSTNRAFRIYQNGPLGGLIFTGFTMQLQCGF